MCCGPCEGCCGGLDEPKAGAGTGAGAAGLTGGKEKLNLDLPPREGAWELDLPPEDGLWASGAGRDR